MPPQSTAEPSTSTRPPITLRTTSFPGAIVYLTETLRDLTDNRLIAETRTWYQPAEAQITAYEDIQQANAIIALGDPDLPQTILRTPEITSTTPAPTLSSTTSEKWVSTRLANGTWTTVRPGPDYFIAKDDPNFTCGESNLLCRSKGVWLPIAIVVPICVTILSILCCRCCCCKTWPRYKIKKKPEDTKHNCQTPRIPYQPRKPTAMFGAGAPKKSAAEEMNEAIQVELGRLPQERTDDDLQLEAGTDLPSYSEATATRRAVEGGPAPEERGTAVPALEASEPAPVYTVLRD